MSSTPEEGEDGALEDAIDLPDEAPPVGGTTHGSEEDDQEEAAAGHLVNEKDDAPVVDSPEQHDIGQGQDAESLVDEEGAVSLSRNIKDDLRSEEDTLSIPDDTPSIQVPSKGSGATNLLKVAGFCSIFSSQ